MSTMFLFLTFVLAFISTLTFAQTPPPSPSSQQCSQWISSEANYQNHFSPACKVLTSACIQRISSTSASCVPENERLTQLWGDHVCVAAATCQGTTKTVGIGSCLSEGIAGLGHAGMFSISIDVWNQHIATYCSTAPGRCPVSRQNFIDFIYRTLDSTLGSGVWPDAQNEVISLWWAPIAAWSGDPNADRVDYGVFNDWLFRSFS